MLERNMAKPILLLTRPKDSAVRFLQSFTREVLDRVDVIMSPLLEIAPTGAALDDTALGDVIFTSANAVQFAPAGRGRQAFCVGEQTKSAATAKGWQVAQVAPDADRLVAGVIDSDLRGPLTHLAGHHRRGDIAARLSAAGIITDEFILYDQNALPLSKDALSGLVSGRPLIMPVFSPRTAEILLAETPTLDHCHVVAISPTIARLFASKTPKELLVAQAPNGSEMCRSVENLLSRPSLA